MEHQRLAILVPVLRRPHRVQPLLESIHAATPNARVIFVCDRADTAEITAVRPFTDAEAPLVTTTLLGRDGNYATKVFEALAHTREPLVFLGADDLHFEPGWFEAARAKLTDGVQVVGVNDLCNPRTMRGEHATHFLMTREYTLRPTIDGKPGPLCQRYRHNCVDDELIATAKQRGAYAFAKDSHVRHDHPMVRRAPMDSTYRRGLATLRQDRRLFRQRERLWTAP